MQALTFVFAFVAVLALIGAAAWLVRRFAGNRLGANANRGRMPRLAVIDAAAVDGRRRLVLVRRDNIEHLLMIGGPTDIVVESNIVRASPARDQMPQRPVGAELPRMPPPAEAANWQDIDSSHDHHPEPHLPEPPPRPVRPPFADEPRRPQPAIAERRGDPMISGFVSEPLHRPDPPHRPEPRPEPRVEPAPRIARGEPPIMPRPAARPIEPPPPARTAPIRAPERAAAPPPPLPPTPNMTSADQNLADMAQRLEAALRRPVGEPRSEPAEPRVGAPPVAPEPPLGRSSPRGDGPATNAARNDTPAAPTSMKSGFENLEDEMASLLGRPKNPS
jgi:flagellar protein FliO/FliZ